MFFLFSILSKWCRFRNDFYFRYLTF
jgi:hypothetical protein